MDRKSFFSILILSLLMTLLWMQIFPPEEKKESPTQEKNSKTTSPPPLSILPTDSALSDSAKEARFLQAKYGVFAPLAKGQHEKIKITTDKLNLVLNTKGALLQPVYLSQFKAADNTPLTIFPPAPENQLYIEFGIKGHGILTKDLYFTPSCSERDIRLSGNQTKQISLRGEIAPNKYIEHIYTFRGDAYDVGYQIKFVGLNDIFAESRFYLKKDIFLPQTEKSLDKMLPELALCYKNKVEDSVEYLNVSEEDTVINISVPISWVAFRSQFFNSFILCNKIKQAHLANNPTNIPGAIRHMSARLTIDLSRNPIDSTHITLYYGPNDVYILRQYGQNLDKIISLGWGPIRYVTEMILFVFKNLEKVIGNSYGIIIFLLAIFLKILLFPLSYKSTIASAKLQIVNRFPEIKEIEERYKNDPTELQKRKMAFYQLAGVNIFGGCLPLLLQMPIFFAMFTFFPRSIELRQQSFLWADDLSTYDSILDFGKIPIIYQIYGDHVSLFALLMTGSTLLFTFIQQKVQGTSQPPQFKFIAYAMPLAFLSVLNNYSAGLSYYYFVFTMLSIGQTYILKAFIDEKKLEAKIRQTIKEKKQKNKNTTKSKFQQWLEMQQKKQQELLEQRKKQHRR
ncbi:MAG: membrane protein insertase YidC [Bacteroidia bacterium]|nr:membrane protein insertase YidC [Bacteroidia bacterium]